MIWVSWRQQRTETLIAAAILALLAALLVPTGIDDGRTPTTTTASRPASAPSALERLRQRDPLVHLALRARRELHLGWFTLVPGLIGVLLAAPFVLELENGTYRLAWTQSITRRRWIATKLGVGDRRRAASPRSR